MLVNQAWLMLISLVLVAGCGGLLLLAHRQRQRKQVEQRLQRSVQKVIRNRLMDHGKSMWRRTSRRREIFAELGLLLRRTGKISNRQQVIYLGWLGLIWLCTIGGAVATVTLTHLTPRQETLLVVLSVAATPYLMLVWLRQRVKNRMFRIEEEMLLVLQMIRILWDVGISLESMLRILTRELQTLAPEVCLELQAILSKIDNGKSRDEAIGDVFWLIDAEGFQDFLMLLVQVSETGGSMSQHLLDLYDLLIDRRRTELQERVSKLSGRMSAVMMVCLLPALLIVLAGPGFLALVRALGQMGT
ncbi:type II secretion system F family protein [Pokkaliibacter sp. CJK22405]|uniref:type II secretion system F family protein n=1 Tax=Pokkaliibacter sp. CJK22405 TaxID=3384615 RepID=UPI0039853FD4